MSITPGQVFDHASGYAELHPGSLIGLVNTRSRFERGVNNEADEAITNTNYFATAASYTPNVMSLQDVIGAIELPISIMSDSRQRAALDAAEAISNVIPLASVLGSKAKGVPDLQSILSRPGTVYTVLGIGKNGKPDPAMVANAASVVFSNYLLANARTDNVFLLDAVSRNVDAKGVVTSAKLWELPLMLDAESQRAILSFPISEMTYIQLLAISGPDSLREKLSPPPSAIVPTEVLSFGAKVRMNLAENPGNLQNMMENAINDMISQHPDLNKLVFDEAIFAVAMGIPGVVGVEMTIVDVQLNHSTPTAEEMAASKSVASGIEVKPAANAKKPFNIISNVANNPYVFGLGNVDVAALERKQIEQNALATAASVPPRSKLELSRSSIAKQLADKQYVVTILLKKGVKFAVNANPTDVRFSSWYKTVFSYADLDKNMGDFQPNSPSKVSFSADREAIADGQQLPSLNGVAAGAEERLRVYNAQTDWSQYSAFTSSFVGPSFLQSNAADRSSSYGYAGQPIQQAQTVLKPSPTFKPESVRPSGPPAQSQPAQAQPAQTQLRNIDDLFGGGNV